jgi:hypothetical protein
MALALDSVLLRPGDSVTFTDQDDLLEKLDQLKARIPGRDDGRTKDHREHWCIVRYLAFLTGDGSLSLPVTLTKLPKDPPDFVLEWADGRTEEIEVTNGSIQEYEKRLTEAARSGNKGLVLGADIGTPDHEAAKRWAEILFSAFRKKAQGLIDGNYSVDHLLLYDLTGLSLLVPLEDGSPLLRRAIESWTERERPVHRFRCVSVLRGLALLFDVTGEPRILSATSPRFRLSVIRADGEDDLRHRLRELDRYCRENSIRHLMTFGSVLSDREDDFTVAAENPELPEPRLFRPETSDLDLLVEFEPDTQVTLFDMARMERELSELTGFNVDLRTADDLSRYFRQTVLDEAVGL